MYKKILFLVLPLLFLVPFIKVGYSFAVEGSFSEYEQKILDNKREQEEVNKKINELKDQEVTLKNQISYMEGQISLTKLKIEEARLEIEEKNSQIQNLEGDIGVLGTRIDRLSDLLIKQRDIYTEKVVRGYKESRITFLDVIFGGDNFSDIVRRVKYLSALSVWDQKVFAQMKLTESNFKGQRTILTEKKETVESLRAQVLSAKTQMEGREADLTKQKQSKADLLALTQNDEKKFQEVLARLKREEEEMRNALGSLFSQISQGLVDGKEVTKDEIIGLQGNTGNVSPKPNECVNMGLPDSCGSHLHFMVLVNPTTCSNMYNCHADPTPYLDSSEYAKPMAFPGGWRDSVTQYYGQTSFASSGVGGYSFHSGIDFAVSHGSPIHSIYAGKVYYGVDSAGGKFAVVTHNENLYSAYWHLQ